MKKVLKKFEKYIEKIKSRISFIDHEVNMAWVCGNGIYLYPYSNVLLSQRVDVFCGVENVESYVDRFGSFGRSKSRSS